MRGKTFGWVAGAALCGGLAVAGTITVTSSADFNNFTLTNATVSSGTVSITTIDTLEGTHWQREPWINATNEQLAHVVVETASASWGDECLSSSVNLDGAPPDIAASRLESIGPHSYRFNPSSTIAATTMAGATPGGQWGFNVARSIKSGTTLTLPATLNHPGEIRMLTTAARGGDADYTLALTFDAGAPVPIVVPIKGRAVSGAARNSTPAAPPGFSIAVTTRGAISSGLTPVSGVSVDPALDCDVAGLPYDEIIITLPVSYPAAATALTSIGITYPGLTAGPPPPLLPGPIALSLAVAGSQYEAAYTYKAVVDSSTTPATALTASAGANAFYYRIAWDGNFPGTFPNYFGDIFLEYQCGDEAAGTITWSGAPRPIPGSDVLASGAGLAGLSDVNGAGSVFLGPDACEGEYIRVFVDIVAAFDVGPTLESLTISHDVDADLDGFTAEGLFDPDTSLEYSPGSPNLASKDCQDSGGGAAAVFGREFYYADADGDGFGNPATGAFQCPPFTGKVSNDDDCDDGAPAVRPGAVEITGDGVDQNCDGAETCFDDDDDDGFLDTSGDTRASADPDCNDPNEGKDTDLTTDCNDSAAAIKPGATELPGDGVDQDCLPAELCFDDDDDDGFLDSSGDTRASADADCDDPNEGKTTDLTTDCNDSIAGIKPGAIELPGDGVNQDCALGELCFDDDDDDGFLDTSGDTRVSADDDCDDPNEGKTTDLTTDCNDALAAIKPGAAELAGDSVDQNCDGAELCFDDDDDDGFLDATGDTRASTDTDCNDANEGTTLDLTTDCNDTVAGIRPGAAEGVGDGVDQNCDGSELCFDDDDDDGVLDTTGDTRVSADVDCSDPNEGTIADLTTDCNDTVAAIRPGVPELTGDSVDQNCDGTEVCFDDDDDDGFLDASGDTRASADTDCADPNEGTVADLTTDCNDTDVAYKPVGAIEVAGDGHDFNCSQTISCFSDDDRDGQGDAVPVIYTLGSAGGFLSCDQSGATPSSSITGDCNDSAIGGSAYKSTATETVGIAIDFNCDRDFRCFPDADHDGYGDQTPGAPPVAVTDTVAEGGTGTCDNPSGGYADDQRDCQDGVFATHEDASEPTGTQTDRNCDSKIVCFADVDADTFGSILTVDVTTTDGGTAVCSAHGGATVSGDCNDTADPLDRYNPASTFEAGGGVEDDFNCNGVVNCYRDHDKDGQGTSAGTLNPQTGLAPGSHYTCQSSLEQSANKNDCDDNDATFFLGAPGELPGVGHDKNCDATILCFVDADDDGDGSTTTFAIPGVILPGARVDCDIYGSSNDDDCLDTNPAAHPGGVLVEVLEVGRLDEDCDGTIACWPDDDRDGFGDEATDLGDADCFGPSGPAGAGCSWGASNPVNEPVVDGIGMCLTSQGHADDAADCHDDESAYFPGATHLVSRTTYQRIGTPTGPAAPGEIVLTEIPGNPYDDNCDGNVLCFYDADSDGYGVEQALSTVPSDFLGWSGTRQPTPTSGSSFDRLLGGTYTCAATRHEAPVIPGPIWDCNDNEPDVFPGAPEADGAGDDNDCDANVFCFIDNDGDSFGGSTDPFPTPSLEKGYISGVDGPELCTVINGFTDNGDDCHDDNQFANPDVVGETPGHTPAIGDVVSVPGVGLRAVGPNPGQFDYCGDGGSTCYNKAFDDDCDGVFECYSDIDGDGWGTDILTVPYPPGVGATPTLTCIVPTGALGSRRAALGGPPSDPNRDCHPEVPAAFPFNPAGEITGNPYDDNCDNVVACYQDLDDDGTGIDDEVFITWSGVVSGAVDGYVEGTNTFDCDLVDDMAAVRGSLTAPVFDCHDNYQFAHPGVSTEVPGHTPDIGDTVTIAGTPRVVGPGPGQFDMCGDGSSDCYGVAMDEDCDLGRTVFCYIDTDGDGVGGQLTTTEKGIVPGSTRPWDIAGVVPTPYTTFTCDTTSGLALDGNRRSSIGGNVGQPAHDCNDGNSGVYPTTVLRGAPAEVAGHTVNPSNGSQTLGFDENCDGIVECFEDQDQDSFGTKVTAVDTSTGAIRDVTALGTAFKAYDCEALPGGGRSDFARRGGARGTSYFNPATFDCHDNNDDAHPGASEEHGTSVEPLTGGFAAFDENCDGQFTCYRDRDDDGIGTDLFAVARTSVLGGRIQLPNGSLFDDGVYNCELLVSDLSWAPGVEQTPLTGRGGAPGSDDFDCHDDNGLAGPDVAFDPPGDSLDSDGDDTHAYDDDCDGVVQCYRNFDGDLYGTFTVDLTPGATTSSTTIAKVVGADYYDCDNGAQKWAGRGGNGTPDFDCHDDSSAAYPAGPGTHYGLTVDENPRDAFDNDCNGVIECFEDRDNDGYGTRVVNKTPGFFVLWQSPAYVAFGGRSASDSGMLLYVCGREAGEDAGLAMEDPSTPCPGETVAGCLNLDDDRVASLGGARGTAEFDETEFDCHDDNPDANPVSDEERGSSIDPLSGDTVAFDEDCDGQFTCYRDRDNDNFGTNAVDVSRASFNGGFPDYQPGGSTSDDGIYNCDLSPPGDGAPPDRTWDIGGGETHLSGIGGGTWGSSTFDCHDTNALAYPGLASGELIGDTPASDGSINRAWDDDCDTFVDCLRDYDGDGYGTYIRVLSVGATNNDGAGTIALVPTSDFFECDNVAQNWAGRGGEGNSEFDCHDDNEDAHPDVPGDPDRPPEPVDEIEGDAYDNDCDGDVDCYEDLDNDEYGTAITGRPADPDKGFPSAYPDYDPLQADPEEAGMLLFPCGTEAADDADLPQTPELLLFLTTDQRAEQGGDCHDNWEGAHPNSGPEVAGNPWDDDCNGLIKCYVDNDGDGFGFTQETFGLDVDDLALDLEHDVVYTFLGFKAVAESPVGALATNVLPAYPFQAHEGLGEYMADDALQAERAGALTDAWYDCRGVAGAAAAGGVVGGSSEEYPFVDCRDDDPATFPGFTILADQVHRIAPEERFIASGPFDPTCDGPIMCVVGSGSSVLVLDRLTVDDRSLPGDGCTSDEGDTFIGGNWRCFEPQGQAYVPGHPSDAGEVAGDGLDNDCDSVVLCYDDVDLDKYGTMPVIDGGAPTTTPFGLSYSCDQPGEAEVTGDCHDHKSSVFPKNREFPGGARTVAPKGADLSLPPWQDITNPVQFPSADGWDDSDCDGLVLCFDGSDGSIRDRQEVEDCEGLPGGRYICFDEVAGNALDEDCDGVVACWYDADADGYGRDDEWPLAERVKLIDSEDVDNQEPLATTADPGEFTCAQPLQLVAEERSGDDCQGGECFDCNDDQFFENPGGVEEDDLFVGVEGDDRERAFEAVGNDIDENCDGVLMCWRNDDGDGYGAGVYPDDPSLLTTLGRGDFEDEWDGTGYLIWDIEPADPGGSCDDAGLARIIGDCHDDDALSNPDGIETAGDAYDNDCDGNWSCFEDLDGDGFGSSIVIPDSDDDRECTSPGEADDELDCLDDNLLALAGKYPINPITLRLDLSLAIEDQPTIAFLSRPVNGVEIYGDGYDGDCDGAELCFVDRDGDSFVDGTPQGRDRDVLNRQGFVYPLIGVDEGVITCDGAIVEIDGEPADLSNWPLGIVLNLTDDPFTTTSLTGQKIPLFDCNDLDPAIKPDATERYYDGIDQNCDYRSDYDNDNDGYDDRATTAEAARPACPADPADRYTIDPVVGCGQGTDCDDVNSTIHPAPGVGPSEAAALAVPPEDRFEQDEPSPPGSVVTRYPPFAESEDGSVVQAEMIGLQGVRESCEVAGQVDNDCDGSVNTYWDCWFDIWAFDGQLDDGDDAVPPDTFREVRTSLQQPYGAMSREYFTRCVQTYGAGSYYVDRSDPLDYTPAALTDPVVLAEAIDRYDECTYWEFEYDADWEPPPNGSATRYYRDTDGDLAGDGDCQGVRLCDPSAEPDDLWLSNHSDCDDEDITINGSGTELCDLKDNNCNGEVDEFSAELTPEISSACEWHFVDGDRDTWGLREEDVLEGSSDRYCLCPAFQVTTETLPDGTQRDVEPEDCEHWREEGQSLVRAFGHKIGGQCYVRNDQDCDDLNFNIRPFEPGEQPYELIDGVDNDCDDALPLIELDCDDDNSYPYLPNMTTSLLEDPTETPIFGASGVGLEPCAGAPPKAYCWSGIELPLSCDTRTGLWEVPVAKLIELEKFSGAARVARPSECSPWDCDDQCPSRCVGLDENCDGIDNDCNGYAEESLEDAALVAQRNEETDEKARAELYSRINDGLIADDLDGIPDSMQASIDALGLVQPGELDIDGDGHISCAAGAPLRENQTAVTDRNCRDFEQFLDCNDQCGYAALEGIEAEECNGFITPDLCVDPGESDDDGDQYRSCGTFGPEPASPETVFVLVYSKGDVQAYLEKPDLNKMSEVVPLIPPRRYSGPNFSETSVAGEVRECDYELRDRIESLIGEELPDTERQTREELLSVCIRAEACDELRRRIEESSGLAQSNDHDDTTDTDDGDPSDEDIIEHTDDLIPAAPTTGGLVLPAYCAELEDARCSLVKIQLGSEKDADIYNTGEGAEGADAWRDGLCPNELDTECKKGEQYLRQRSNACVYDTAMKELYHPEQAIMRSVWSREQIVAARKLVVEFECYRTYGTFGCDPTRSAGPIPGDESWESPYRGERVTSGGFFELPDVPIEILHDHPEWWMYVNRFLGKEGIKNKVNGSRTLVGCWGDPTATDELVDGAETIDEVGGDCKTVAEDKERFDPRDANRGMPEGPGDLMARYLGEPTDCTTCVDDVDNNCNSLIDQDEPACAQCFVGQGYGCGCSAGTGSGSLGRTSAPVLALSGLLLALARRRKRA